ncbi:hypothetical protein GCM10010873_14230 [Cypionkella aquatica]|uniref:DUF306 domain-containing protein n=1 Tax=Cypionkella aquatica TaxID=1756042 RepID=A0AA37X067_9RHOB|nr:META domain-containing protein [Cypionkella aquatica]GLS86449.1 hypothetical protein GCM10010873_14230 [Cypionkella aquatica]
MKVVWMAALMLAACVQTGQAGTEWVLASVDGTAVAYTATLSLADPGRVTGQAPCNRYFAEVTREGERFQMGLIGATRMACLQMQGEAAYFQALQGIETATETATVLVLSGAGHEMIFTPAAK